MTSLSAACSDEEFAGHGRLHQIGDAVSIKQAAGDRRETRRANYVISPNGDVVTMADLPSPGATRWVIRRKAEVVLAVHAGMLSLDEACRRYRLTVEEFFEWQNAIERHGLLALRTTQLQQYRHGEGEPVFAKGRQQAPRPSNADRFVFTDDDVA